MAYVHKRIKKDGSVSFQFRVFLGRDIDGRQVTKSMTWTPPASMRPTSASKQAEKEAVLFEERVRSGIVSPNGKIKFKDYTSMWLEMVELAPKTRSQYTYLLQRINKEIGHISLEKLRANRIQSFIKRLREDEIKTIGLCAKQTILTERRKAAELTQHKLGELSGVSVNTIGVAESGKAVSAETAKKLCDALNIQVEDAFTAKNSYCKLSERTIRHHYKLIHTILESAKMERIVQNNEAEYMKAPKSPRGNTKHLSDVEAREFLSALEDETDIRIKTVLTLELFTGMRKGELCGLTWKDIDFDICIIHVRRASQYIPRQGIITVPTKNESSERSIKVTPFVMTLLSEYKSWWLTQRKNNGDIWKGKKEHLFIQSDGKPIFPDTINFWLKKFLKRNNLPNITPHGLRHTFITLQITAGVDLRTIQARSGHAQASTLLDIYSHTIQSAQERAAQAMDEVLFQKEQDKDDKGAC